MRWGSLGAVCRVGVCGLHRWMHPQDEAAVRAMGGCKVVYPRPQVWHLGGYGISEKAQ